jgi:hypothetical protein
MSAPSTNTPPQVGQKFIFKPDRVIEFKGDLYPWSKCLSAFIFNCQLEGEIIFYPDEMFGFIYDKDLIPI